MKGFKTLMLSVLSLLIGAAAYAQSVRVTGTVTDAESGEPVIGAAVIVRGTTNGTSTDLDGNFSLTVPAGSTLEFSCIGYTTINVAASPVMNVRMSLDTSYLDEVVVTGYMSEKKADLTGSVAVVKMKDVTDIPTGNVLTALQGRVAGMNVTADGTPGGQGATSKIRGTTTFNNTSPLYVIDGVMTRDDVGTIVASNDIESMQVLKDAASAAIYGAQAANGVVIITTKKAKEGQFRIDLSSSFTLQTFQNKIPLLNAQEWGDVYWAAYEYDYGKTPTSLIYGDGPKAVLQLGKPYYDDGNIQMLISDTDWVKECYHSALMQSHNLSMSKGTKDQSTSLSFNFLSQPGVIRNSDYTSFGTRLNNEYRFLDNKLKVGESVNITYWKQHKRPNVYESIDRQILKQHPAQAKYASDGSYAGSEADVLGTETNPIRYLDDEANNIYYSWRIFGNAYIDITPIKNLSIRSSYGVNYNTNYSNVFAPAWDEHPRKNTISSLTVTNQEILEWVWTNTAQYNLNIGQHSATFLIGAEAKKNRTYSLTGLGDEYALTTRDYVYLSVAEGTKGVNESANIYAMNSYFAKVNYSFAEKYLLSATVRRDASSRFGANNNAGIFPSASVGWRLSKESFMDWSKSWLSDLKFRFSWGINGNDQIPNTATYNIYAINIWNGSYNLSGDGHTLTKGAVRSSSGNPNLRWEQTEQINFGIDAAFLNNRLNITADYYNKETTGMLYQLQVAAVNGEGGASYQNCASMNNKGVEGIISWKDTKGDFNYEISANLAWQKNAITYLPEDIYWTFGCGNLAANVTNVGLPYGGRLGYVTDGLFRTQQEVDDYKAKYNVQFGAPGVGRIRYKDVNNDGSIDLKDQAYIGCDLPVLEGGLNFSAGYKGFDLTIFFNGMVRKAYNQSKTYTDFFALGEGFGNHSKRLVDATNAYYEWKQTGVYNSKYPAPTNSVSNREGDQSDWYVENGSFIKLKNVVLGYTIPSSVLSKVKIRSARVYLQGQNLFTITKYSGADPEALGYPYPIARSYVFGLNIGF